MCSPSAHLVKLGKHGVMLPLVCLIVGLCSSGLSACCGSGGTVRLRVQNDDPFGNYRVQVGEDGWNRIVMDFTVVSSSSVSEVREFAAGEYDVGITSLNTDAPTSYDLGNYCFTEGEHIFRILDGTHGTLE